MITQAPFGTVNGQAVNIYTLRNRHGMSAGITNYGGIVTSLVVPDKQGGFRDVVLGFDHLEGYLSEHPYFGCIVGRYANRIAGGMFELDGQKYMLARNNGPNHLHGGMEGFDKKIWKAEASETGSGASLRLDYLSKDGEEGYPGNLEVTVIYTLTGNNELQIDYTAVTDAPVPVNLTHHGYFNLDGQGEGDILGHSLQINADRYTEVNEQLIPTGELPEVDGTPMDFRVARPIGKDFDRVAGGYDHNFVLREAGSLRQGAILTAGESGILMEVLTTEPGLQFYSGNFLDGSLTGKAGKVYHRNFGLCLEAQHFPDSPNRPEFPGVILRPGQTYRQTTVYRFDVSP